MGVLTRAADEAAKAANSITISKEAANPQEYPILAAGETPDKMELMPASYSSTSSFQEKALTFVKKYGPYAVCNFGLNPLCWLASCRKPSAKKIDKKQAELLRDVRTLNEYVKKQKVADVSKVHGVYVAEYLAQNPHLVPFVKPEEIQKTVDYAVRTKTCMTAGNFGLSIIALYQAIKKMEMTGKWIEPPSYTYIVIPASEVKLIHGTKVERESFDSIFYHEVEGHGTDFIPHSKLVTTLILPLVDDSSDILNSLQEVINNLKDATEFSAYIKELDRLITKKGFARDPNVVDKPTQLRVVEETARHGLALLFLLKMSAIAGITTSPVSVFVRTRISQLSGDTKFYIRRLYTKKLRSKEFQKKMGGIIKGLLHRSDDPFQKKILDTVKMSPQDLKLMGL